MRQEDVLLLSYHDNGTLRWRGVKMEGEGPRRIKALTYRFGDHPTVLRGAAACRGRAGSNLPRATPVP